MEANAHAAYVQNARVRWTQRQYQMPHKCLYCRRCEDVGADIFDRGACLPSDNKMTEEQQERIIRVIRSCFE